MLHARAPAPKLADPRILRDRAYVAGAWTSGPEGASFEVRNPFDRSAIASVASLDAAASRRAVDAAHGAFARWRAALPAERSAILRRWFDMIVAAREDLAALMTLEQGKPLAESRDEIDYGASFVEWFAEEAKRLSVEGIASHLPGAQMLLTREPVGVAALFTPWNFPSAMLARKAAAALAAGCPVVAHVSSRTPLSGLALAELADRAGFPPGVFNVLTGDPEEIGQILIGDPRVRIVSFTGSTEVGRKVAAQCAPTLKRMVMELGGHAPLIIFEDADLDRAVDIAVAAKFATSGQDCLAANRIYVHRRLYARFCAAFARRVSMLRIGGGFEQGVDIGPMMHEDALKKALRHVADAVERGARVLCGGKPPEGLLLEPIVLVDVPDEALLMREETFAPVAPIVPFDSEAEVVGRANDTAYGLVAYVVTADGARALRVAGALDYGMVAINRAKITGAPVPFGGMKQSGMGREGSRHGIEAFTDLKYFCIDLNGPGD